MPFRTEKKRCEWCVYTTNDITLREDPPAVVQLLHPVQYYESSVSTVAKLLKCVSVLTDATFEHLVVTVQWNDQELRRNFFMIIQGAILTLDYESSDYTVAKIQTCVSFMNVLWPRAKFMASKQICSRSKLPYNCQEYYIYLILQTKVRSSYDEQHSIAMKLELWISNKKC